MANPASITITTLGANASVNQPAVQTIDTEADVPCDVKGSMDRLFFELVNAAAAAVTVTFKAGVNPPSLAARDLIVAMAATGSAGDKQLVGPFESARFVKGDGKIDINFDAASGSPNVTVRAYRLPKL